MVCHQMGFIKIVHCNIYIYIYSPLQIAITSTWVEPTPTLSVCLAMIPHDIQKLIRLLFLNIRKADVYIMINPKPVRSFTLAPSGYVVRNCKAQLKAFAKHYRRTQVYPGMLTWMLSRCWSFLGIGHRLGYHIRISRYMLHCCIVSGYALVLTS